MQTLGNLICNGTSCFDGVESLATGEPICALDFPLRVADQAEAVHREIPADKRMARIGTAPEIIDKCRNGPPPLD